MSKYLLSRLALVICLCLYFSVLSANTIKAQVTVSDPVIDETTHGDWRGTYGDCFYLLPDPDGVFVEVPVGPDLFSVAPEQYNTTNCFGGSLFPDELADRLIDFRIYRGLISQNPTTAFAWTQAGTPDDENPIARQWNPCKGDFKGATWDDGDPNPTRQVIPPMSVDLEVKVNGSLTLAYYFVPGGFFRGDRVCRTQDYEIWVDGNLQKTGTISNFEDGKYVVFDISGLTGNNSISFRVYKSAQDLCIGNFIPGVNEVISGVFISNCQPPTGEIGDFVWCDLNNNGIQDSGEPGIPDVDVNLKCVATDGTVLFEAQETTGADGMYLFTDVPAGACEVTVDTTTAPADKALGDNCVATHVIPAFDPAVTPSYLDADFCFKIKPGVIGDLVWCDLNDDGVADFGEPGIPDVVVNLSCFVPADGSTFTAQTVTDADGMYLFKGVPAGLCTVDVDVATVPADKAPGANCPTTNTVALNAGQSYLDADFCFRKIFSEVGDFVWCDLNDDGVQDAHEPGIGGVVVNLKCTASDGTVTTATQTTDADGKYLFTDVPAGTCEVTVDTTTAPAGKEPGTHCPTTVNVDLAAGQSFLDADFCFKFTECGECDGKVTSLTLQYNGADGGFVTVKQKRPEQEIFASLLNNGDKFTVQGVDDKGTLSTGIELFVDGKSDAKIHTSCSQPIGPGLISGSFEVISGKSRNGGRLCPIDNGDGDDGSSDDDCCDGKVTSLTLKNGGAGGFIVVTQKNGDEVFAEFVDSGQTFSFIGTDKGTLGTEITVNAGGVETRIHTSCSQPIGIGSVFGNYTVISGFSLKGGELCPVDELDDGSGDDDSSDDHKRKCKKSHWKDHKRSHKNCDKKSHKKHHRKHH